MDRLKRLTGSLTLDLSANMPGADAYCRVSVDLRSNPHATTDTWSLDYTWYVVNHYNNTKFCPIRTPNKTSPCPSNVCKSTIFPATGSYQAGAESSPLSATRLLRPS